MNAHQKRFIKQYNQENNLLVISNYPPRGEGVHTAKIGGVAGFAKNTLIPLARLLAKDGRKIVVLADVLSQPTIYEEEGILIVRCWKRDHPSLYISLLESIKRLNNISEVLIEFEFSSYGDFWTTSLFPLFLGLLRALRKRTTVVVHQVLTDLWSLYGHLGIRFDSWKFKLFSGLLPAFYLLLTHLAGQTVVLEDALRVRLNGLAPMDRVTVIPHGIEIPKKIYSKATSRRKLSIAQNEFVVLSFGFITWYKGTNILLDAFDHPMRVHDKPVRVVIAGGPSTTQRHKAHYQSFFDSVLAKMKGKRYVTYTGFVPAKKLAYYFCAADVVVFPYQTVMSSSGPLSLALAYGKPILLSEAMRSYFASKDIRQALREGHLFPQTIILPTEATRLAQKLTKFVKNGNIAKVARFGRLIREKRSFTKLAFSYYTLLETERTFALQPNPSPALSV